VEEKKGGAAHEHEHEEEGSSPMWMYASIVLFVLLLISLFAKKRGLADEDAAVAKPTEKEAH